MPLIQGCRVLELIAFLFPFPELARTVKIATLVCIPADMHSPRSFEIIYAFDYAHEMLVAIGAQILGLDWVAHAKPARW